VTPLIDQKLRVALFSARIRYDLFLNEGWAEYGDSDETRGLHRQENLKPVNGEIS